MKNIQSLEKKIYSQQSITSFVAAHRLLNKTIAFTNGCFDIFHQGHIDVLSQAAKEADVLIVGVNTDACVKRIKGANRPVNNEQARLSVLSAIVLIDALVLFDEDTPLQLINIIKPDVLIKGGDYTPEKVVGAKEVTDWGGRLVISPLLPNISTSLLIEKIMTL